MRNRTPVPRDDRPPIPEFTPVPRLKYRHDGWTPERQKAFIEALADCGSVRRAAAQVNMSNVNAYALRRAPGAESFRQAWEAALDFAVLRLKDIAFERAIEGQLFPVFKDGKLMGFSRKTNDALLMFCLRHYGQDANGRRTTIDYFSTRATAGAAAGSVACGPSTGSGRADLVLEPDSARPELVEGRSVAEASTTTVRTVINGRGPSTGSGRAEKVDAAAGVLNGFEGVELDAEAQAAIQAALEACAARARAADEAAGGARADFDEDDPGEPFVRVSERSLPWRGELLPAVQFEETVPFHEGEDEWQFAGAELPEWAAQALPEPQPAARPPRKRRRVRA